MLMKSLGYLLESEVLAIAYQQLHLSLEVQ
jgi:hypothetical protein